MSTKRKLIRAAIKTALLNNTDCDNRVFISRVTPTWITELPCALIYDNEESVENWAEGPREYQRVLNLAVQIEIDGIEETIDDNLDTIGQQVEVMLYQDHTLGELCHDVILTGSSKAFDRDGKTLKGSLTLNYQIVYHTIAALDPNDLEWLNRVDVEYGIFEGAASSDDPVDTVTGIGE